MMQFVALFKGWVVDEFGKAHLRDGVCRRGLAGLPSLRVIYSRMGERR